VSDCVCVCARAYVCVRACAVGKTYKPYMVIVLLSLTGDPLILLSAKHW